MVQTPPIFAFTPSMGFFYFLTATLGLISYVLLDYYAAVRRPLQIYAGRGVSQVLNKMPTMQRAARPPIWFYGRHAQFFPWYLMNLVHEYVFPIPFQRLEHPTADGKDSIFLDVYPPLSTAAAPLATVLLLPGVRGQAQDIPGNSLVRRLVSTGKFRAVIQARRGIAQPLKHGTFHLCPGSPEDVDATVRFLREAFGEQRFPAWFVAGVSVGSGLAVLSTGVFNKRRQEGDLSAPELQGCAGLVPGYDITESMGRLQAPYSWYLLRMCKEHFVARNREVLRRDRGPQVLDKLLNAQSLQEIGDLNYLLCDETDITDAESFYAKYNPVEAVRHISTTPVLLLNALDDPICVKDNYLKPFRNPQQLGRDTQESCGCGDCACMPCGSDSQACGSHTRQGETFASDAERSELVALVASPTGTHIPFLDGGSFNFMEKIGGVWLLKNWMETATVEYFEALLT